MSAPEHEKEVSAHSSGSSRSMRVLSNLLSSLVTARRRHSMTDFPDVDLQRHGGPHALLAAHPFPCRSESVISFPSPKRKQFLASPKVKRVEARGE